MKRYISPETSVFELQMRKVILNPTSLGIWEEEEIDNDDQILTKGVINNKSIWEEEW